MIAKLTVVTFGAVLTLGLFAAPLTAGAQQANKVYRIGYMGTTPPPAHMWEPFLTELRARGWVEGQNIIFERRFSEGRAERFKAFAEEFIRLGVDMILTAGGLAPAQAAKDATATLPIVLVTGGDPVVTGLVASLPRPGGNITGLSLVVTDYDEIHIKRLELLKLAAPKISQVGVIYSTIASVTSSDLRRMEVGARALGVALLLALVNSPNEFTDAFAALTRKRADALLVADAGINYLHRQNIAEFAARNRLPTISAWREAVEVGGLISYGVSLAEIYRRAAIYVDKILRGAKPAELPIEQPTKLELVINLKTAKALGLTIPQSLLLRADQVIE